MNVFKTIARIRPKGFWNLIKLAIPNFLYLWPTYRATKACMQLSTEHFGRKHYQNGPANAFRHALWNVLIAKYCTRTYMATRHALAWTTKITNWHEETFFSKELPMKMDYHNNQVGRSLFMAYPQWELEQFINELLGLTLKAIKITRDSDLNQYKNQLVFITDDY